MIITARDLHKSFGSLEVLKGVDVSVDKGEVLSVVGASGAGKTTLLQILGTLSAPDSGMLEIDGVTVFDSSGRSLKGDALASFRGRKIGFVFQEHHLLPEFSAVENISPGRCCAKHRCCLSTKQPLPWMRRPVLGSWTRSWGWRATPA